jgi:hypothetical protein
MAQEGAGGDPTHLRPPREYSCDGSHFLVVDDLARKVLGVLFAGAAVRSSFRSRGRLWHGVTQAAGSLLCCDKKDFWEYLFKSERVAPTDRYRELALSGPAGV